MDSGIRDRALPVSRPLSRTARARSSSPAAVAFSYSVVQSAVTLWFTETAGSYTARRSTGRVRAACSATAPPKLCPKTSVLDVCFITASRSWMSTSRV